MNNWTIKEEEILLNYIKSDDSGMVSDRITFAHYMMYSNKEGAHPELKKRTLGACISRYYKASNKH